VITLSQLLESLSGEFPAASIERALIASAAENQLPITSVTSDSREVNSGSIFVAIAGTQVDGHAYLREVAETGAAFLIGERPGSEFGLDESRYLAVPDARLALALLASELYGNPSREMLMIGVTGTSGKTTTAFLLESILKAAGRRVGLIGTVSFRIDGREIPSTHTTPGPVELQKLLRRMRDEGCDAVAMEVSSHALKQHRAAGIAFDGALFTNLSAEHLDYHPDMEDYFHSKAILFSAQAERSRRWGKETKFAVHAGTEYGDRLKMEFAPGSAAFSVAAKTKIDAQGIRGKFSGIEIDSKLIGRFNAENIAGAVAIAKACGIAEASIRKGIAAVDKVPGRLEQVADPDGGRIVLVDYAHKPDALEKVLEILRPMRASAGKLFCVFGCGGDRDRKKRPVMGEIACRLADRVFLTSDNPRTEDPEAILDAIETGCAGRSNFVRVTDRKAAISQAIRESSKGDIVLIAGKGHEDYQILGTEKVHFDDREVAAEAIRRE
jgi:UDP-N-acetylmuramoyl-L-alanyl-D-glutamate--2,6-diaminopimelate ligase